MEHLRVLPVALGFLIYLGFFHESQLYLNLFLLLERVKRPAPLSLSIFTLISSLNVYYFLTGILWVFTPQSTSETLTGIYLLVEQDWFGD